ncbi:hypothetical protein GCM10011529_01490 [Polymorphobacter glacialis]|uniref:Uncharacterized protein n=1 Tax=Sandarakinorhabdus glacialis TaxID=1614636 RepID=A0A916ZJ47_9SPHN|nr:hypothetical protein [Polymorphobacter glacialis]GGD99054.1 hypothetical protein GCM10011529_01490 [Polymorphobacter glacialis]
MADDVPPPPLAPQPLILSKQEAGKRLAIYTLFKLVGLAALFAGVYLLRGGWSVGGVLVLAAGAASMFVRPWMLGLTVRPVKK